MDKHVKALGIANISFGVFSVLFALFVFIFFGGPVGMYRAINDDILGILLAASVVFHMLLAVPSIAVGIHLRSFTEWSRSFAIVVSALNLLNVPFGCLLGGYGLWVLLAPETDPLFSDRRSAPAKKTATPSPSRTAAAGAKTKTVEGKPKKSASTTIIPSPRS
jgi:hypothetical protein